MSKNFNDFRFSGLNYREKSNKYLTMGRVSSDECKIVVKVADSHIIETKYGYALILDSSHVVFLKEWQVSRNFYGNEVLLTKEYWNVKEWGEHLDIGGNDNTLDFSSWVDIAKAQDNYKDENGTKLNEVKWKK